MSDPTTETASGGTQVRTLPTALTPEPQAPGQGRALAEADSHGDPEVELVKRAAEILGVEQMVRWMKMRIPSLNHRTPLSLMDTEAGRQEVARVLTQIEHGIF